LGLAGKKTSGKPRLLIVLNRFVIGGQAVDTLPLAYYLNTDFDILIAYGEKEKDEIEPNFLLNRYSGLKLKKVGFLKRSINPLIDVIAFFQLLTLILKFKPHIVHTHGAKSGFLGRLSAWLCRVPVIVHTFHGHFFHSYFSKNVSKFIAVVERWIGTITTSAIALSEIQKEELTEEFKILPGSKFFIIPLGFDSFNKANTEEQRQKFRLKYGLHDDDVAIGIVGRIVPVKNHSFFVEVIKLALETSMKSRVAFFIVGDGEVRSKVENELEVRNISYDEKKITPSNRVIFTSWLTDMDEVMNGLDIIALTSLNEGTPLSIAYLLSCPGRSFTYDGVTGFLTEKTDVNGFFEKLKVLIEDKNLRLKMGEAGYHLALERFSKQKEVASTKEFYFSLLRKKGFIY